MGGLIGGGGVGAICELLTLTHNSISESNVIRVFGVTSRLPLLLNIFPRFFPASLISKSVISYPPNALNLNLVPLESLNMFLPFSNSISSLLFFNRINPLASPETFIFKVDN